jgi:hypothetical protein
MASLYIEEFESSGIARAGQSLPAGLQPGLASQKVAIGGTSTQSAAFNTRTRFVRLHTDAICSVEFGASPTADNTNMRMGEGQTEYFSVNGGDKVAVITNT